MKLIPNWQEQDLTCHFCGTKKSVKYELEIHDFESNTPKKVCCCNMCALTQNKREVTNVIND